MPATGDFLFDMDFGKFIDGEDADVACWTRFMNSAPEESASCNVRTKHTTNPPRLWFVTLRDIRVGEELAYNYGPEYWEE